MKKFCLLSIFCLSSLLYGADVDAYFSPNDNLEKQLIDLIDREETSIKVAIYTFTNRRIAKALIAAKKRGVDVEVILDSKSFKSTLPANNLLAEGVSVYVFEPKTKEERQAMRKPLLHHKFCIFEKSGKLWTGSFNFTYKANTTNLENAVVIFDRDKVNKFSKEYSSIREKSNQKKLGSLT